MLPTAFTRRLSAFTDSAIKIFHRSTITWWDCPSTTVLPPLGTFDWHYIQYIFNGPLRIVSIGMSQLAEQRNIKRTNTVIAQWRTGAHRT